MGTVSYIPWPFISHTITSMSTYLPAISHNCNASPTCTRESSLLHDREGYRDLLIRSTLALRAAMDIVARQIALVSSGGKRWVSIQRRGRVCVGSFARANTRHPQAEEAGRRKGKGTAAHRSENGGKVISIVECLVTRLCTWGRGSDASPVLPDR